MTGPVTGGAGVCRSCGAALVAGGRFCVGCGRPVAAAVRPRGAGWDPTGEVPQAAPAPTPGPYLGAGQPVGPSPPPAMPSAVGRTVEGQARGLQIRSESDGAQQQVIWSFRVERYDQTGNRVMLVPVEMRAQGFQGSLNDGDWVRAHGKLRSGTFQAKRVENLTTGAVVQGKGTPVWASVVLGIAVLAVLAFIGWIVVSGFFSDSSGPPPGFEDFSEDFGVEPGWDGLVPWDASGGRS